MLPPGMRDIPPSPVSFKIKAPTQYEKTLILKESGEGGSHPWRVGARWDALRIHTPRVPLPRLKRRFLGEAELEQITAWEIGGLKQGGGG